MENQIQKKLFKLQDKKYAAFQTKLTPNIPAERFIGVRVPELRKLAKNIVKNEEYEDFLERLPHQYYDENILHGLIISEIKDYETCVKELERFLPFMDNWAVCDITSPKIFKNNKDDLIILIKKWSFSDHTYTCRFGIGMLMEHFLDGDFKPKYLEIPAKIKSEEYYVKMMIAWFFATALAKQWDETLPYIKNNKLDAWTHNKTIQKARESFRISNEQKLYLSTLKRK